jgi:energy-coupling factor transporter ATP-binding protein EcfA2
VGGDDRSGQRRVSELRRLHIALDTIALPFDLPGAELARSTREELANQIDDYLIPRLERLDAPLLAVLGGSTGSGKSTIVNSVAGADVSPAGVLRPTTRAPVLVCHPDDLPWFSSTDVLPHLPRISGGGRAVGATLKIEPIDSLTPGLALIDAPDIDSIEEANRELATQLLAAADLWLFVTTAVRYADAVPWEFLGRARSRGTALAIVINRMPPGAAGEIVPHLQSMLIEGGLSDVPIFTVENVDLNDSRLPSASIGELTSMLRGLATDADERARVVRTTLGGALASVPERARLVLAGARAGDAAAGALTDVVNRQSTSCQQVITDDLTGGALLRGEVLDRWQELIGTNEMMRAIQSRISSVRDRIAAVVRGRPKATNEVQGEITSTLEQLLTDRLDANALAITNSWRSLPGGPVVLDQDRSLERLSDDTRSRIGPEIRAWQDDILELVRERGTGKRNMARVMAFGVNSIGVALMIVLFAQTGGITGGEVAVASGTAGVSQALLNAIFGEQAVRELATAARDRLLTRVDGLIDAEAMRYRSRLDNVVNDPIATAELAAALAATSTELDDGAPT